MVKITLEIKDDGKEVNVKFKNPTEKQLEEATENEKIVAQKIKDIFDNNLLDMINYNL
jgi:hypothetical protein